MLSWLTGDEKAVNAIAHALDLLDPTHITIDLTLLSRHPSPSLRQIAAAVAATSTPPDAEALSALAADHDWRVRWNLAQLLPRIATTNPTLATELRSALQSDASWTVRKSAARLTT